MRSNYVPLALMFYLGGLTVGLFLETPLSPDATRAPASYLSGAPADYLKPHGKFAD